MSKKLATYTRLSVVAAMAILGGCNPSATVVGIASLPERSLVVQFGDGGVLEAQLLYDAGSTCLALPHLTATLDGLPTDTMSVGQPYVDFNGNAACYPPSASLIGPAPGGPVTSVSLSDGTTTVSASFQSFETAHTAALAQSPTLNPNQVVDFSVSPTTDLLDPTQTNISYLPTNGSAPVLLATGTQLTIAPGGLSFVMPSGIAPGEGALAVQLIGTALPTGCDGVDTCSAAFDATVVIPVTVASTP